MIIHLRGAWAAKQYLSNKATSIYEESAVFQEIITSVYYTSEREHLISGAYHIEHK